MQGRKKRGIKAIDGFTRQLFIPDHQIYDSIEHKVKSKIGRIFVSEDNLKNIPLGFTKLIFILVKIIVKKYKLIIMVNKIYCLELTFILLNNVEQ